MRLQIDQIDLFDAWISQAEQRIATQLNVIEQDLLGVERQYGQLGKLQDELVAQQQITESLQNMVIVIDDSSSSDALGSKYSSTDVEGKLLNLSERWAQICTFVQTRWIQLQEIKIELEQIEFHREKVHRWLTRQEDEVAKIIAEKTLTDADILMQQVHSIQVIRRRHSLGLIVSFAANGVRNGRYSPVDPRLGQQPQSAEQSLR